MFEVTIPTSDAEFYEVRRNDHDWKNIVTYYASVVIVEQILDLFDTDVIRRVGLKINNNFITYVAMWDNIDLLNFLYNRKLLPCGASRTIAENCKSVSTLEWLEAKNLIDFKYEQDILGDIHFCQDNAIITWLREHGCEI